MCIRDRSIIAAVIAAWMLGGAAAAGILYRFILRSKKEQNILMTAAILPVASAFLLISGIVVIRFSGMEPGGGTIWEALAVCMAACIPAGFSVFLSYLLSAELLVKNGAGRHANLAPAVYLAGFLAAGIIHSVFLAEGTSNFVFAYWIGIINFAFAYIITREKSKQAGISTAIIVVGLILYLVPSFGGGLQKLDKSFMQKAFKGYEVLYSGEHSRSRITLVKKDGRYGLYKGNSLVYSKPDEKYWKLGQILSGEERILLINGGFAGALQELLKQEKVREITYVESDPGAAEVMSRYFGDEIKENNRIKYFIGDPVIFMNSFRDENKFDAAAIVFTGKGSIEKNRLYCSQFINLVKGAVKQNGTLLIDNGHGSWVVAAEDLSCIYETENRMGVRGSPHGGERIWPAVFVFIIILSGYFLFSRKDSNEKCGADCFALFIITFCAFLMQAAVMFIFQGLYGLLYKNAGMLLAFFGAGAALGCALVFVFENKIRISMVMIGGMILAVLTAFFIMNFDGFEDNAGAGNLIIFFMVFAGLISGAGVSRVIEQRKNFGVHGLEYIGASAGSLAGGVYIIPVYGFMPAMAAVFFALLIMFLLRVGTTYKMKHDSAKKESK